MVKWKGYIELSVNVTILNTNFLRLYSLKSQHYSAHRISLLSFFFFKCCFWATPGVVQELSLAVFRGITWDTRDQTQAGLIESKCPTIVPLLWSHHLWCFWHKVYVFQCFLKGEQNGSQKNMLYFMPLSTGWLSCNRRCQVLYAGKHTFRLLVPFI